MEPTEILSLVCSILGAILFIFAFKFEIRIMNKVKKLRAYKKWQLATSLTAFFFIGYLVNIISILAGWTLLAQVFGALVYLLGGAFVLLVVYVSFSTYKVIFEAAEE